jgi:hypothetical protein
MPLNIKQQNELERQELESFKRLCDLTAISVEKRERIMINGIRDHLNNLYARILSYDKDKAELFLRQYKYIIEGNDLWRALRDDVSETRLSVIEELNLYISSTKTLEEDKLKIKEYLESIPTLLSFDLKFNGFIKVNKKLNNLAFVCVYQHLYKCLEVFIDNVALMACVEINSNVFDFAKDIPTNSVDFDKKVEQNLKNSFDMLFGINADAEMYETKTLTFSQRYPDLFNSTIILSERFVWYHEYGHLLLGHLRIGACHKIEFEADEFAFSVINKVTKESNNNQIVGWTIRGIILLFVLFEIIEKYHNINDSYSHPTSRERLNTIFKYIDKGTPDIYLNNVVKICNPILRKYYKIEL